MKSKISGGIVVAVGVLAIVAVWELRKYFGAPPVSIGQTAFFQSPGVNEVGTINSTGGFTAAPDPDGIGGGFAT